MKIVNFITLTFLSCCLAGCSTESKPTANIDSKNADTTIHSEKISTTTEIGQEEETATSNEGSDYFRVVIEDSNGDVTNIREKPSGKIILSIPTNGLYETTVCEAQNQWWFICRPIHVYGPTEKDIELPETGGWIHSSVLTVSSRNYGEQELRLLAEPDKNAKVVYSTIEEMVFHPIDKKGEWVKVISLDKKVQGWIEQNWLCGNAVSNCS